MSLVGHVITGYKGTPHVTASDAGLFNAGIVGLKRYVLGTGEVFRTAVFSNRILIYPGDLVDQGRHINLPAMAEMHIPSAPLGYQRRYIIAMKYMRDETGVESAGLYLIEGVAAQSNPALPTGIRGDIFAGAAEDDTYLYGVLVDETGIVSCEPNAEDFIVIKPLSDIRGALVGNTVDITQTTGSEQYAGWYYADFNLPKNDPSAISVISTASNRPTFVQLVNRARARVYCNQANVQVTIRCLYCTL